MDRNSALNFLREHQPLPTDNQLSQELIDEYDAVRKFFRAHPDKESLGLFFGSFGKGSGLGVYQLVEDTIMAHNAEDVIPALNSAIKTGANESKYWCIQIAANYPDERLLDSIQTALENVNVDIREAAITALECIGGSKVMKILKERLLKETDQGVRDLIEDVLSS